MNSGKLNIRKTLILFSLFIFLLMFYLSLERLIMNIENKKNYSNTNSSTVSHKIYKYSDILSSIKSADSKFKLDKINPVYSQKNILNLDTNYEGDLSELENALLTLNKEEMFKSVNQIKVEKELSDKYKVMINIDYFKYK